MEHLGQDTTAPTPLTLAPSTSETKLDIGGGQNPRPGFDCVDLYAPDAKHKVDLFKFPWPFESDSVDEINCSHFIEHIPARSIEAGDVVNGYDPATWVGRDMLLAFFDECWRILKKDAWLTLVWPSLQSVRAFQDPTHRRFIPLETMSYLNAEWRKNTGLDHYPVKCNFNGDLTYTTPMDIGLTHPEAQRRYVSNMWNTTIDYQSKMQARK